MTNLLWTHSSVGESAELIPLESVEGSSPSGSTIYLFSSTDRISGYEPEDEGSIPLGDTIYKTQTATYCTSKELLILMMAIMRLVFIRM